MGKEKPEGYWKDFGNVRREIQFLIKDLGHFPTSREIGEIIGYGIVYGIKRYHKGFVGVREKFGYKVSIKKPNGYYKNVENVRKELEFIIQGIGHFPTQGELRNLGRGGLQSGISKYQGGMNVIRVKMGYKPKIKSPGYWQNFDNIKKEIKPIIQELGRFPTQEELIKRKKSALVRGLYIHYGGLNGLRKKCGYSEVIDKPRNYWKNFNNVKRELEQIIKELGHFPTHRELDKIRHSGMRTAIHKYHGGLNKIRDLLGYRQKNWKDFDNVKRELKIIIQKLEHFPTCEELKNLERGYLLAGIYTYHGGINKLREIMGHELVKKPNGYYKNFDNVKRELEPITEELGHFPVSDELKSFKRGDLLRGIEKYHCSLSRVRELMGYPPSNNHKIKTEKSLVDLLDNDEKARRVVERFGGDIGDVADILAVVYEGRLSQDDAAKLVAKPSLRAYLGRFRRPIGGIGELAEISNELLPHDKNDVIKGILYRKVNEYIYQKCGPYPSKEKREDILKEFEGELSKIKGN